MNRSESDKCYSVDVGKIKRHRLFVNPPKEEGQSLTYPFLGDVSFFLVLKVGVLYPV